MKTEKAIFLDNTLDLLRDFFSNPENKNKLFWPDCPKIKQLMTLDVDMQTYTSTMERLYIPGYWVIVDYREEDLFVFSNEEAIKNHIINMDLSALYKHSHFIDPNGTVIKILPEIRVNFESENDGIA
jgi:hypothetical protein